MHKSETRSAKLKTLWGEVKRARSRYRCAKCHSSQSMWSDPSLDGSDCTPLVLARMQEFALDVPYRKVSQFMKTWGVEISHSEIGYLSRAIEMRQTELGSEVLNDSHDKALVREAINPKSQKPRMPLTWMLEIDGSFVPTRIEDQAGQIKVEYREVKTAVLYQKDTPSQVQPTTCPRVYQNQVNLNRILLG